MKKIHHATNDETNTLIFVVVESKLVVYLVWGLRQTNSIARVQYLLLSAAHILLQEG